MRTLIDNSMHHLAIPILPQDMTKDEVYALFLSIAVFGVMIFCLMPVALGDTHMRYDIRSLICSFRQSHLLEWCVL